MCSSSCRLPNIVERDLEKVPELVATYILEKLKLGETITIIDIDKEEDIHLN